MRSATLRIVTDCHPSCRAISRAAVRMPCRTSCFSRSRRCLMPISLHLFHNLTLFDKIIPCKCGSVKSVLYISVGSSQVEGETMHISEHGDRKSRHAPNSNFREALVRVHSNKILVGMYS